MHMPLCAFVLSRSRPPLVCPRAASPVAHAFYERYAENILGFMHLFRDLSAVEHWRPLSVFMPIKMAQSQVFCDGSPRCHDLLERAEPASFGHGTSASELRRFAGWELLAGGIGVLMGGCRGGVRRVSHGSSMPRGEYEKVTLASKPVSWDAPWDVHSMSHGARHGMRSKPSEMPAL
jgi:hypothetical protein